MAARTMPGPSPRSSELAATPSPPPPPGLVSTDDRSDPPASGPAALGWILLGWVVFALVAARLQEVRPRRAADPLTAKLAALSERVPSPDTLFVGSSMVYRHLDPARFDAATAAAGRPTRSFNLGAPGMSGLELSQLLTTLDDERLPALRRVLFDWRGAGVALAEANRITPRVQDWHDAGHTLEALALVVEQVRGRPDVGGSWLDTARAAWPGAASHLVSWAHRTAAVGALGGHLEAAWTGTAAERGSTALRERTEAARVLGPAGDGFLDLTRDRATAPADLVAQLDRRREHLLADRQRFERQLAGAQRQPRGGAGPGPVEAALLARFVHALAARGLAVYGIDFPDLPPRRRLGLAAAAGLDLAVLDLGRVDLHPELFRFESRFDRNHLDAEGAARLTDALAVAWLAAAPEVER